MVGDALQRLERGPSCKNQRREDTGVNEETQKRAITILATGIAALLSNRLSDRFLDVPEERGIQDDVKEALLKAGFTVISTVIASVIIRRVVSGRWGT
jgi:hypothetical protein